MLHGGTARQVKPTLTQQYGIACHHNLTDMLATDDISVHCVP
jgi:hypothetical protein